MGPNSMGTKMGPFNAVLGTRQLNIRMEQIWIIRFSKRSQIR